MARNAAIDAAKNQLSSLNNLSLVVFLNEKGVSHIEVGVTQSDGSIIVHQWGVTGLPYNPIPNKNYNQVRYNNIGDALSSGSYTDWTYYSVTPNQADNATLWALNYQGDTYAVGSADAGELIDFGTNCLGFSNGMMRATGINWNISGLIPDSNFHNNVSSENQFDVNKKDCSQWAP